MTDVSLKCSCGAFSAVAHGVVAQPSSHVICYCDDCQAYAFYLGRSKEILDGNAGTDILPITPAQFEIREGAKHLRSLRLTSRGMLRWYASCCKTAICNTPASPKVAFVGLIHTIIEEKDKCPEIIGPIRARIHGRFGVGKLPPDAAAKISPAFLWMVVRSFVISTFKRQNRPTPFFNPLSGEPAVEPYVLSPTERERLRRFSGKLRDL